ncbi:hypothetical protein ZIOFF_047773 [Zingiber officinale]|uniref:SPX domain-containing protein n=1 Tax=Zingiber officinale TaxID=94328 RepID=A0A8J5FPN4_ZINOF|nr:hypothetical protein ZIOFF_047773 [Zingiber officinale]
MILRLPLNARLLTDEATEEKGDRGDLVGKLRGQTCRLVKILKKYDKRTGALIRQPFIEKVLQQPFFTTDLLCKLVKECVAMLDHLFPSNNLSISAECDGQNGVPKPAQSGGRVPELEEIKYMQSLYMKSTVAALRSLKQIRSKSSTVLVFAPSEHLVISAKNLYPAPRSLSDDVSNTQIREREGQYREEP